MRNLVAMYPYQARQRSEMRLESMKSTSDQERQVRRQAHAKAILKGITMRQAVFEALELWVKEGIRNESKANHQS